jgi:hypothetical protein
VSAARPRARKEGLLIRDLGDEVVVYELESHRGHSLNRTAALVWRACDGRRSVAAIAARLGRELGAPPDAHLVRYTLRRLQEARLLDPGTREAATLTRRQVARRVGQLALLPVVVSLLAPSPSEAATCAADCTGQADGTDCWNGSNCTSYNCCGQSCCAGCNSGIPVLPCYVP